MATMFPGRHFSFPRLAIVIVSIIAIISGSALWLAYTRTASQKLPSAWFGGYADVTATPSYAFESDVGSQYANVILGFVTAKNGTCTPAWGGYGLDEASRSLDLDSRIAQTQRTGRNVTISFGGQAGGELARYCSTSEKLANAYFSVVSRYHVDSVDFDLEGANLSGDTAAELRRVEAIATLVRKSAAKGIDLSVTLTLPVGQQGLTNDGEATVESFLTHHIELSTLNLMTMDYNVPSSTTPQSDLIMKSLNAAHDQYRELLYTHGHLFDGTQVWQLMGATVLIGRNDTANEYFTLDDAQTLNTFAQKTSLGQLSMWSLNRDRQCGDNYGSIATLLTFCSSMKQNDGQYAAILSATFTGSPGTIVPFDENRKTSGNGDSADPYPQWSDTEKYLQGSKVVWKGNIYQALSTNTGIKPTQSTPGTDSPWRIIGPVL
ncbi:MAG: glycosyl hydrolase family 18 protein [Bifidobacterium sp.]|jgi:chitinase|nr:glycosyl hydrolase family 18 protein [Bifidobacterium sp.]MCI1865632.1 glycosyl hydrolase family 18 protein [Bifidobacterium sp.]